MEFLNNLGDIQKLGFGGLVALPFIAYQIYRLFKDNNRGDKIDARIDAYGQNLQNTVDKLVKKLDDLSLIKDKLVADNAIFSAQLIVAKKELEDAAEEIKIHVARIKYLEGLIKEKGIEDAGITSS